MKTDLCDPQSQLMSAACAALHRGNEDPRWQVAGFVTVMYQDGDKNVDSNKLIELARQILHWSRVDTRHWIHVGCRQTPYLATCGLQTHVMLGVCPIDADKCCEPLIGTWRHGTPSRKINSHIGTCVPGFCEANIVADATASPEYSLTNPSAPADAKPKR